jgi:hypothetical protein
MLYTVFDGEYGRNVVVVVVVIVVPGTGAEGWTTKVVGRPKGLGDRSLSLCLVGSCCYHNVTCICSGGVWGMYVIEVSRREGEI